MLCTWNLPTNMLFIAIVVNWFTYFVYDYWYTKKTLCCLMTGVIRRWITKVIPLSTVVNAVTRTSTVPLNVVWLWEVIFLVRHNALNLRLFIGDCRLLVEFCCSECITTVVVGLLSTPNTTVVEKLKYLCDQNSTKCLNGGKCSRLEIIQHLNWTVLEQFSQLDNLVVLWTDKIVGQKVD